MALVGICMARVRGDDGTSKGYHCISQNDGRMDRSKAVGTKTVAAAHRVRVSPGINLLPLILKNANRAITTADFPPPRADAESSSLLIVAASGSFSQPIFFYFSQPSEACCRDGWETGRSCPPAPRLYHAARLRRSAWLALRHQHHSSASGLRRSPCCSCRCR